MSTTVRVALILYSEILVNNQKKIFVLLPLSVNRCITTFGGRKKNTCETDIECLIRELTEESRGVLDYSKISELFNSNKNYTKFSHCGCLYIAIQDKYENLKRIKEIIENTKQKASESEEISAVELFDIDELIYDLAKDLDKHYYTPAFRDMFLSVGYDFFKKNLCNRETKKIGADVKYYTDIGKIPHYVSLHLMKNNLKNIYCEIYSKGTMYVSDQYYGFINGEHLFRKPNL